MLPAAEMFKNRLQEYAHKNSLPLPFYDTVNEGEDHLPLFKCTVTINRAKYESPPPGFHKKKAAQNAAAKVAVEDLQMQGLLPEFKEKIRPKNVLAELASRKNMPPPNYRLKWTFTAIVEVNGVSYTGGPSNNQKDALNNAAFEALQAIDPQYCNSLFQAELNANNDSKHPECDASKFESKLSANNLTSDNQLLGGTESLNVDGALALEKDSEKTYVGNPCAARQGLENPNVKDAHEAENGMPNINDAHSVPAEQPHNQPQPEKLNVDGSLVLEKDSEMTDVDNLCEVGQGLENPKAKDAHETENGMLNINDAHSVPAKQPHNQPQLENLNVDGALAIEKDSEKTDVENPCAAGQGLEKPKVKDAHEAENGVPNINDADSVPAEQPHNQPQQDLLSAQQGHLKKETGDAYLGKEHGSEEMQQISQELELTESINKRSRSESENAEQMSPRKKLNRTETDGTA